MKTIIDNWEIIVAVLVGVSPIIASAIKAYNQGKKVVKFWEEATSPDSPDGAKLTKKEQEALIPLVIDTLKTILSIRNMVLGIFKKSKVKELEAKKPVK